MAGKLDVCLFDKTGTLTTDELVAVGVEPAKLAANPNNGSAGSILGQGAHDNRKEVPDTLLPMPQAPAAATLVLGGCQSLVLVEDNEAGDPVETAAMKAIKV